MPKLSWKIARAYIAGDNRETALGIAREWNQRGASVILNFLGEHLREESVVLATLAEYLVLIHRMRSDRVRG